MPAISPPAKVLVTGSNGFIATHVVKTLIDRGFTVRGTVRSAEKGEYLVRRFGSDKFEYTIVADIGVKGAFDDAVKEIDAVEHIATAVDASGGDPDLMIKPAVEGTVQILDSIAKFGTAVRRVAITSSAASIVDSIKYKDQPKTFSEEDWNDTVVQIVNSQKENTPAYFKYTASKLLAERAAWKWFEDHRKDAKFDVVVLCPSWVFGPMMHKLTSPRDVNGTNIYLLSNILHPKTKPEQLLPRTDFGVDVRDVARVHVDVLSKPEAANERFIVSGWVFSWQDVYDTLQEPPAFKSAPLGLPSTTAPEQLHSMTSAKLEATLGIKHSELFHPMKDTIRGVIDDLMVVGLWDGVMEYFGPRSG